MGFVVGNFGSLSKKEATPVAAVSVHALPPLPQQASSLPNWMPVSAENGTGSVTLVAMARVTSLRVVMTNEVGSRMGLKNGGGRGSIRCRREKGVFLDRCSGFRYEVSIVCLVVDGERTFGFDTVVEEAQRAINFGMDRMRLKLETPVAIADRLISAYETLMTQDYRYAK
ncbi:hypothetical protein JHK87_048931 [Glycine soja]|nr:hypothetical protein JHK87_048931 [Glycine soja]